MGAATKIEWATHTWNPWRGCEHAVLPDGSEHPGCAHCYAEALSKRNPTVLGKWGAGGHRTMAAAEYWQLPRKWNKLAACIESFDCNAGDHSDACPQKIRPRVFTLSMGDMFEDWQGIIYNHRSEVCYYERARGWSFDRRGDSARRFATMDDLRRDVFGTIDNCHNLDWLILTKRPENVRRMWLEYCFAPESQGVLEAALLGNRTPTATAQLYRRNVWLLTSVSDQSSADKQIPHLLDCRDLVPVLGLSIEPMLGPVNFMRLLIENKLRLGPPKSLRRDDFVPAPWIDWVIAGGESGPHARPMHPNWVRSIRDQCLAAGVPFFFKQWGEWAPRSHGFAATRDMKWGTIDTSGIWQPLTTPWNGHDDDGETGEAVMVRVGKHAAGRLLDGREWSQFPVSLGSETTR